MEYYRYRAVLYAAVFVVLALVFGPNPVLAQEKLRVVTSFTILADMARNVAGDAAEVHSITKAGAEIHGYQPTPKDIVRALDADVILWNGLNLERWYERFLQDTQEVHHVTVSDGVRPLSIYAGPYDGKPNPHAWMSLGNAEIYIRNIERALAASDPVHAAVYTRNADAYIQELHTLGVDMRARMRSIPKEQRVLVTSEGAFSYLAQDFEMDEIYLWPINAEQQGTPQQVRAVIDQVRARNVPVVFSESTVSDRPARQVAQETGARYGGILYVDSLSKEGGPVPTYLDLLRVTTDTIARGFDTVEDSP